MKITSLKNERLKKVITLRERKNRCQSGLTIVEGITEVSAALKAEAGIVEVYLCCELLKAEAREPLLRKLSLLNLRIFETTKEIFSKIAFGDRKEGILAVCRFPAGTLGELRLKKEPLLVVVEHVEKPGNLGAIIRTCEAAGVDALITCDEATDIYNPNVIRASVGAIFFVKTVAASHQETLAFLKAQRIKICATTPSAHDIYFKKKLNGPLAIILGSEEKGLSDFWLQGADMKVRIPMRGKTDSLNVSTTAAIMIYEVIRQWENP